MGRVEKLLNPFELDMALTEPVFYMMRRGIRVDLDLRREFSAEAQRAWDERQIQLDELARRPVNVNSTKDMKWLMYEELGLPVRRNRKRVTCDENAIRASMAFAEEKIRGLKTQDAKSRWFRAFLCLKLVLMIRHVRTEKSRYLDVKLDDDSRARCIMTIGGTETMRFSHSKTLWGTGMNLATIPHGIRRCFIADEGMELAEFDLNRGESWVYSYLSGDPELIRIHEEGLDFHAETAATIQSVFGSEDLTAEEIRRLAKDGDFFGYKLRFLGKKDNHACVSSDTEVLTRSGWITIESLDQKTEIAQWDETNREITFTETEKIHSYDYNGVMYHFNAPQLDQLVTPNHRIPYITNDNLKERTASELYAYRNGSGKIPYSGAYNGCNDVDENLIRLTVAVQADATRLWGIKSNNCVFHLKKKRKITRITGLLESCDVEYVTSKASDGSTYVRFHAHPIFEFLLDKTWKVFNEQTVLTLSANCLDAFINEIPKWDGSETDRGHRLYFSAQKKNADLIKTIAHLRNQGAVVKEASRAYKVSINARTNATFTRPNFAPYIGKVYCVTVPSSWFLIRRNGKISVTGNSAYRMGPFKGAQEVNKESDDTNITVTPGQMRKAQALWMQRYFGIERWWDEIDRVLEKTRVLTTPLGRRRKFFGFMGDHLKKEATAYVPQSTSVDYLNRGMLRVFWELVQKDAYDLELLHQNHDSILVQYPIQHRDTLFPEVISRLESTINIKGHDVTIPVEGAYGENWGDYNPDENPEGLREWGA